MTYDLHTATAQAVVLSKMAELFPDHKIVQWRHSSIRSFMHLHHEWLLFSLQEAGCSFALKINMSILLRYRDRVKYLESLVQCDFKLPLSTVQTRSRLGSYLKQLKELEDAPVDGSVEVHLENIYAILAHTQTLAEFKKEYQVYRELVATVPTLDVKHANFWGSRSQLITAKCTIDGLNADRKSNLHFIWGALLNPTGGIIGPGNTALLDCAPESPIGMHACIHDAAGYLYNFHGLGPGYNYLRPTFMQRLLCCCRTKGSPLSGQINGIAFWVRFHNK